MSFQKQSFSKYGLFLETRKNNENLMWLAKPIGLARPVNLREKLSLIVGDVVALNHVSEE